MKKWKKIPKIVKHLKNFLTDESWKITKHNALWLWAVWAILTWIEWWEAHHHSTWYPAWSLSRSWSPSNPNFSPWITGDNRTFRSSMSCPNHSSWIVNGNYYDATIPWSWWGYYATHNSWSNTWSTNTPYSWNRRFYLDCGAVNQSINGHYSSNGGTSSSRSVYHTSSHSNY